MTKLNINQLITSTTHHKPKCKPSLIDLILTKNPELVLNIKHNPPIAKSHHQVITAQLKTDKFLNKSKLNKDKIIKPNFEKTNFHALNKHFNDIDWVEILKDKNVNDMWISIKTNIQNAQTLYVPNKTIFKCKVKPHSVTFDDNLHCLLKDKRYLFKIYKKYKTKKAQYNYNLARNKVTFIKHNFPFRILYPF